MDNKKLIKNKENNYFAAAIIILLTFLFSINLSYAIDSNCGDGICDLKEAKDKTCAVDCDYSDEPFSKCGDGECNIGEKNTCPKDCLEEMCGDGLCDIDEAAFKTCPEDCASDTLPNDKGCGDGVCDMYEASTGRCEADCEEYLKFKENELLKRTCGNGACEMHEAAKGACPQDCDEDSLSGMAAYESCGDGVCDMHEAAFKDCPADCQYTYKKQNCGDGFCDKLEGNDGSCPEDCGEFLKKQGTRKDSNNPLLLNIVITFIAIAGFYGFYLYKEREISTANTVLGLQNAIEWKIDRGVTKKQIFNDFERGGYSRSLIHKAYQNAATKKPISSIKLIEIQNLILVSQEKGYTREQIMIELLSKGFNRREIDTAYKGLERKGAAKQALELNIIYHKTFSDKI